MVALAISLYLSPLTPGQKHRDNRGIFHCGSAKDCFLYLLEAHLESLLTRMQGDPRIITHIPPSHANRRAPQYQASFLVSGGLARIFGTQK